MSWFRRKHEHKWDEFAPFKRRCGCGREEWLFQSEFPRLGVPGLSWKDMTLYPPPSEEQQP
jgi:hypothetical protein